MPVRVGIREGIGQGISDAALADGLWPDVGVAHIWYERMRAGAGLQPGPGHLWIPPFADFVAGAGLQPGAGHLVSPLTAAMAAQAGLVPGAGHLLSPLAVAFQGQAGLVPGDGHLVSPLTAAMAAQAGLVPGAGTLIRGDIVATHLLSEGSTLNQDAYPTSSFSLAGNVFAVMFMLHTATTAAGLPISIPDTRGLTWTQIATINPGTGLQRLTAFGVVTPASAPGPGTATFNFANGDVSTGCCWSISQFSGVSLTTPYVVANIVASNATANTTCTITLPQGMENTKNMYVWGLFHATEEDVTPDDFTALGYAHYASPGTSLKTAYKLNDLTAVPNWTTSSITRWLGIELKSA